MKSGSHNCVFVVVLILIFKISASASQENRNALNYDPTVLLQTLFNQGGQNNSHILAQLNNALRSFLGNNSNFNERMINILKQNVTNGTQEKNNFMKNVRSSVSSLKDGLNSAGLPDIDTIATVLDAYLQNSLQSVGVQQSCYNDLKKMASEASSGTDWALRMLDAFGKPGSNLKNFQTKWLGSYDECIAVKAGEYRLVGHEPKLVSEYFAGKYCYLSIPLKKGILPIQPQLMFGACLPSTCSSADINTLLNAATAVIPEDWKSKDPGEAHCAEKRSLDAKAVVAIGILSIIGILMVLGTLYDIIAIQMKKSPAQKEQDVKPPPYQSGISNGGYVIELEGSKVALETEAANADTKAVTGNGSAHAEENYNKTLEPAAEVKAEDVRVNVIGPAKTESLGIIEKALLSFSVYTNGVKILSTHQASGSLGAVNGIRFLSMAWVILGHSYFFAIGYDENIFMFFGEQLQEWSFFGILYASVSVDTFFALSGLLVAYLTLKELKKVGGIRHFNWFMFYFHRFWRLTPVYMLVIMVFTCLMKYWGSGPMWPTDNVPYDNCEYSWWTNLLYVNNLVRIEKTCIGWTWYLANDMQFYILSPLILIPLFYQIIVGGVVSLLFLTATITTTAVIVAQHHYPVQQGQYAPKPDDGDYGKLVYIPPWARMGPYIIGLFTGYLLYRMKCKCRMPKVCVLVGWIICLFICTSVIYSPYSDKDSHIFSNSDSAAYHALSRTGWGIAVCWIVFACATGYGGWINELLSWKAFIPLGRLTYCAYLLHPIVMLNYNMSRRNLVFFNNYEVIYMFLAHLVMSYGVAFVVSLAFESPMMGLEKALLKRDRRS